MVSPGRSLKGRPDQWFRMGRSAVDSVWLHGSRHDATCAATPRAGAVPGRLMESRQKMTTLQIGLLYGGATLLILFSGIPIAFALGAVATVFMVAFMPHASLDTIAQNVYRSEKRRVGKECRSRW